MVLDFVGKGMFQPVKLVGGTSQIVQGKELLDQSINRILSTPIGTTFFLPEFGSRLEELQFEPNDVILESLARLFVEEALFTWEKRIEVTVIDFEEGNQPGQMNFIVSYLILNTNEPGTFVYPFYREITT